MTGVQTCALPIYRLVDRIAVLQHGRFSVDVPIDSPRPRDRASLEFLEQRRLLLRELGVGVHA